VTLQLTSPPFFDVFFFVFLLSLLVGRALLFTRVLSFPRPLGGLSFPGESPPPNTFQLSVDSIFSCQPFRPFGHLLLPFPFSAGTFLISESVFFRPHPSHTYFYHMLQVIPVFFCFFYRSRVSFFSCQISSFNWGFFFRAFHTGCWGLDLFFFSSPNQRPALLTGARLPFFFLMRFFLTVRFFFYKRFEFKFNCFRIPLWHLSNTLPLFVQTGFSPFFFVPEWSADGLSLFFFGTPLFLGLMVFPVLTFPPRFNSPVLRVPPLD